MKPNRPLEEQVLFLNPNGFEQLVQDIFSSLPGWSATRSDLNANDFGADVIAKGPNGTTYAIQCKHYLAKTSSVGVETVGYKVDSLWDGRGDPARTPK